MIQSDLEQALESLPEEVSKALLNWRKATLDREKLEASIYLQYKAENEKATATDLKHMVNKSNARYEHVLAEISFESVFKLKEETLMARKKEASLRTAF